MEGKNMRVLTNAAFLSLCLFLGYQDVNATSTSVGCDAACVFTKECARNPSVCKQMCGRHPEFCN